MGYRDDIETFLQEKRNRAVASIDRMTSLTDLNNEAHTFLAKKPVIITSPKLEMDKVVAKALNEVPAPEHQPINMGVQVGKPFEGIEITIPVSGDATLFATFIGNRTICDGFRVVSDAITIKQYDFMEQGTDMLKNRVKACVDSLNKDLEELESTTIFAHNNQLDIDVANAVAARKATLINQEQRDKNANPWA